MEKPIIYIAGPMTGLTGLNLNSFNLAADYLISQGYEVRNPACLGAGWADYDHYMEVDLVMLGQCQAITLLPGSDKSPGASREVFRAEILGHVFATDILSGIWPELEAMYKNNGGVCDEPAG